MQLISLVRRILPCECPNCHKNTICIYDKYGKMINYPLLLKYNNEDQILLKLKNTDLKYMRCDSCKSVFILDWTRGKIPYPSTKEVYKEFEINKENENENI